MRSIDPPPVPIEALRILVLDEGFVLIDQVGNVHGTSRSRDAIESTLIKQARELGLKTFYDAQRGLCANVELRTGDPS